MEFWLLYNTSKPELDGVLPGTQERPADIAVMEAPAGFHVAAPGCFLAIDVRIARLQEHSSLTAEVALTGTAVERIETAKPQARPVRGPRPRRGRPLHAVRARRVRQARPQRDVASAHHGAPGC